MFDACLTLTHAPLVPIYVMAAHAPPRRADRRDGADVGRTCRAGERAGATQPRASRTSS